MLPVRCQFARVFKNMSSERTAASSSLQFAAIRRFCERCKRNDSVIIMPLTAVGCAFVNEALFYLVDPSRKSPN